MKEDHFDISLFRSKGYQIIDDLANYLESSYKKYRPVLSLVSPEEEYKFWENYSITDLKSFNTDLIERSISLHHPNYIGHQVSAPLPEIALLGLTSELLNNGMGIYEMGAAGTAIEQNVIRQFCNSIGYDSNSSGFLTSGGTLANLTALLAARSYCLAKHPESSIENLYILVSEQAHFCIERAGITMGLPQTNIVKIAVDDQYRIDTLELHKRANAIIQSGGLIMSVVACACSTATGSYDDIVVLSKISKELDSWLHVDGAHGGAAIFSEKLKSNLLQSVEQADSIIIDAHKMMLTPALCTAVLFKKSENSYISFKQKADYLFDQISQDPNNLAKRTYETTKYMMGIKVYYLFKKLGVKYIGDYIERQTDLTLQLFDLINDSPNFEVAHRPMSNILCFRYWIKDATDEKLNRINQTIRNTIIDSGKFYIVNTWLNDIYYLRVTIMNVLTTIKDVKSMIHEIEEIAIRTSC